MKYEWKKVDKNIYLPKSVPVLIDIPEMNYFVIEGRGDPNTSVDFQEAIGALYSLSYAIKMMPKNGITPDGYYDYTVFPLEGVWDMEVDENTNLTKLDKSKFIFRLMIRQPDFVDTKLAKEAIEKVKKKKPNPKLDIVKFETIEEGKCVQIMHYGSYDDEPQSFLKMEAFCNQNHLERIGHTHREIYLSDFRKVEPDKLKTVLRIRVKDK